MEGDTISMGSWWLIVNKFWLHTHNPSWFVIVIQTILPWDLTQKHQQWQWYHHHHQEHNSCTISTTNGIEDGTGNRYYIIKTTYKRHKGIHKLFMLPCFLAMMLCLLSQFLLLLFTPWIPVPGLVLKWWWRVQIKSINITT